jgi:hypothetical protein
VLRILNGAAHVDLGGQMEHHVGVGARDDVRQLGVPDVGRDEGEATGAVVSVGRLEVGGGGAGAEIVDSCHLVSFLQQSVDKGGTDESGRAGDKGAHYQQSPIRR